MAVDIGPKIGIDGEAEFRKSLQNINQQLKTLGSEMNSVTAAFGDNADSEDALTAKSSVLTKQIEAQQKKIDELNKGLTASAEKYGENDTRTLKWQQAVNDANAELSSMKNQLGKTTTGIDENKAAIDSNSGSVSSWKDKLSALGSVLGKIGKTVATAVTGATAAVTAFAKTSIDAGMSFDTSMSQVAATMGTTVDSISELRDFAMEMGANTAFSATEAADALNYMALAGYDSEESMSALPTVLNLAAAGALDLAEASDMVTDVQSALGLSMEESAELVDKMAKAASSSNTSVGQLGSAILTVGGTAKNLAGGTTELSTALGILADNGIKGAEGGTALRNIILSLSAPTEKAALALENLGITAFDEEGNLRPLNETFGDLNDALSGLTQESQINALNSIFNKVDLKSVNALLANSSDRFDELSAAIDNADGAAQAMADTQLDNLAGDITLFKSALEGAQILISDQLTPTLREFVQFGTDALSELSMAFTENGLTGAMEKLGEILGEGLNILIEMLPEFIDAGMQLLGAVGQGLLDNLPVIISAATEIIIKLVGALIEAAPKIIEAATVAIVTLANGIAASLPELIPAAIDAVLTIVDALIDNVDELIDAAIAIMLALADGLINALPTLIEKAPEIILKLVNAVIENAPKLLSAAVEIVSKLIEGIEDNWEDIWESAEKLVEELKNKISNAVKSFIDIGRDIVTGIWDGIEEKAKWLKSKFDGFCSGVVEGVKGFFGINSPSKVFHDEIGAQLAAGVGLGFTDEMRSVAAQMQKSIPTPEIAFNNAAAGMVNGMSTAVAGIGTATPTTIILQTADGQALARWLLPDLRAVSRANPEVAMA